MIIQFETLQNDFLTRSDKLTSKKLFTQNELKQIDIFLNHKVYDVRTSMIGETTNNYRPEIEILNKIFSSVRYGWDTFTNSYNHYLYNEEEKEFVPFKNEKDDDDIKALDRFNQRYKEYHQQGCELAKYVLWLKHHENKSVLSKPNTRKLTNKQKLLALHYLGLNLNKYDNTKTAKILFQVLEIGEQNVRTNLSYVSTGIENEVRTKPNLTKISQLFENAGIIEVSSKIDKDIECLK